MVAKLITLVTKQDNKWPFPHGRHIGAPWKGISMASPY